eukprot:1940985-Amphidinium_carterae.1
MNLNGLLLREIHFANGPLSLALAGRLVDHHPLASSGSGPPRFSCFIMLEQPMMTKLMTDSTSEHEDQSASLQVHKAGLHWESWHIAQAYMLGTQTRFAPPLADFFSTCKWFSVVLDAA